MSIKGPNKLQQFSEKMGVLKSCDIVPFAFNRYVLTYSDQDTLPLFSISTSCTEHCRVYPSLVKSLTIEWLAKRVSVSLRGFKQCLSSPLKDGTCPHCQNSILTILFLVQDLVPKSLDKKMYQAVSRLFIFLETLPQKLVKIFLLIKDSEMFNSVEGLGWGGGGQ